MLYDYFPTRVRTTVIAIYSAGVFIGQGIGIFLGGMLLHAWMLLYPDPATALFGLMGWQVAFFVVGLLLGAIVGGAILLGSSSVVRHTRAA